ncbi:MAG: sensor histidine kinase [Marinicellaceae bacterium]
MKLKLPLLVLVFWIMLAGIYLMSLYLDSLKYKTGFELTAPLVLTTVSVYSIWSGLTWVLYYFLKKPVRQEKYIVCGFIFIIGLIVAIPLISFFDQGLFSFFDLQGWPAFENMFKNIRYVSVFFNAVLYLIVYIVCAGVIYQQYSQEMALKAVDLSKQKSEAELKLIETKMQAIQSQLSPHFLFNCLNAISALTRISEKTQVIQAIARLGDLLRYAIAASQKTFISLNEELEFIENYINLQKLRLGDKIEFEKLYEPHIQLTLCPPFILQTLVENAIVHGSSDDEKILSIKVSIKIKDKYLVFNVSNSLSKEVQKKPEKGLGIAMENLKKRLHLLYSDRYLIESNHDFNHYIATVKLPLIDSEKYNG